MNSQQDKLDSLLKKWISFLQSDEANSDPEDKWLTIPEICGLLRCSEPTIYRKLKNKEISFSKPAGIMIWLSDVAKYVLQKESYNKAS